MEPANLKYHSQQQQHHQQPYNNHHYHNHHHYSSGSNNNNGIHIKSNNSNNNNSNNNANNNNANNNMNSNNNNNNHHNSIFILNTSTNILPINTIQIPKDFNENSLETMASKAQQQRQLRTSDCSPLPPPCSTALGNNSIWSSAYSASSMCSPAAHAIQKLFNCSSTNNNSSSSSLFLKKPQILMESHGPQTALLTSSSTSCLLSSASSAGSSSLSASATSAKQCLSRKTFKLNSKAKAELLKKKSKFWKYLEGDAGGGGGSGPETGNNKNAKPMANEEVEPKKSTSQKSTKQKFKYWSRSYDADNQNLQNDLAELLEYSCSLCDNCKCMDCQIGYFDCENSDDSNSEYSFQLNDYDYDEYEVYDDHFHYERNTLELKHNQSKLTALTTGEQQQQQQQQQYEINIDNNNRTIQNDEQQEQEQNENDEKAENERNELEDELCHNCLCELQQQRPQCCIAAEELNESY